MVRNGRVSSGLFDVMDHAYHRVSAALWWFYEAALWGGIALVGFTLISQPGADAKRQALSSMVVSRAHVLETVPHVRLASMVKYSEKVQAKK